MRVCRDIADLRRLAGSERLARPRANNPFTVCLPSCSRRRYPLRFLCRPAGEGETARRHMILWCGPSRYTSCGRRPPPGTTRSGGRRPLRRRNRSPRRESPGPALRRADCCGNCTIRRCAPRARASLSSTDGWGSRCGPPRAGSGGGSRTRRRRAGRTTATHTRGARRVDADKTAAGADVSLKGGLLARIEDIAGRVEEYDGLVLSQGRVAEPLGVFGAVHRKPVLGPQRLDRRNPLRDRIVAKSGGLGEDEDAEPRIAPLRCKAAIKRHAEECGENKKSCGAAR